jgi:hypothetical protein
LRYLHQSGHSIEELTEESQTKNIEKFKRTFIMLSTSATVTFLGVAKIMKPVNQKNLLTLG